MECLLEELRRFDALRDGDAGNDVVADKGFGRYFSDLCRQESI